MRNLLKWLYRRIQVGFIEKRILPWVMSTKRIEASWRRVRPQHDLPPTADHRMWFHAASVGELESLWPLIQIAARQKVELILTVLSESAELALARLGKELQSQSVNPLYVGYSPWEGEWEGALSQLKPTFFITAKYEAWPDLWISLYEKNIPLAVVSVHVRKSLKIAKKMCELLVGGLPSMLLFPCYDHEVSALKELFPFALVKLEGEPRWDRVVARARQGNVRAKELIQRLSFFPRPWGVLGSIWLNDLHALPSLVKGNGTFWVVPHRVDEGSVKEIEDWLKQSGLSSVRTSTLNSSVTSEKTLLPASIVLVDEMGFLSELYSAADWAFVGGGFGAGVHSTIEPAIYGIPIGIGPAGAEKFPEILDLSTQGQLKILLNDAEFQKWSAPLHPSASQKTRWLSQLEARLGASEKIFVALEKFNRAC